MLIKLGGGILGMSGSIGGQTAARNRFGSYLRSRTKPVNPRSSDQVKARERLGNLVQIWYLTLTAAQRTAWETYAAAINMKNRLGETINLTGFNHYVRANAGRRFEDYGRIDAGPTTLSLPEKDPAFAISASVATQLITITFNDALPWGDIASSFAHIYMGRPQNKTRNFFNGPWRYTGTFAGNAVSPQTETAIFTLVLGQRIWCAMRFTLGDGRLSEFMYANCIVAA